MFVCAYAYFWALHRRLPTEEDLSGAGGARSPHVVAMRAVIQHALLHQSVRAPLSRVWAAPGMGDAGGVVGGAGAGAGVGGAAAERERLGGKALLLVDDPIVFDVARRRRRRGPVAVPYAPVFSVDGDSDAEEAEESWKRMLALAEGVRRVIQEQISADEALAVSLAMELNSELPGSVWQGEEAEGAEAVREGAKGPAGGKGRGPLPLGAPQSRAPVPVPAAPQSGAQRHPGTRPLGPPQSGPQRGRPGPGSCPPPRSRKYEGDDGDPDKPVKRSRGGLPAGATRKSAPRRELPLPVRGGPRKDREGAEHEPAAKRSRRCGHCNVHGHDVRNCPDKR